MIMKILPGIGIGNIQYGMLEKEVVSILGHPEKSNLGHPYNSFLKWKTFHVLWLISE